MNHRRTAVISAAFVVALFLIPLVPAGQSAPAPLGTSAAAHGAGLGASSAAAALPPATSARPIPASPPPASGRGVFFESHLVPNASSGSLTCYSGVCVNVSNDPSINWTSQGTIAVAYTAWTNDSPCVAARNYAQSEIGVVVSKNGGTSWSAPTYLGAPSTCSAATATAEPSAWQPSLTSLANGTLVLAYIAFNSTSPLWSYSGLFGPSVYAFTTDRLVVAESYDNGTTWTAPTTLNVSDNPSASSGARSAERPWATAIGKTVYVAWTNISSEPAFYSASPSASEGVQLLASTNGGASWGATPTTLPTTPGAGGTQIATNPSLVVLPSGRLVVAYDSNFSFRSQFDCQNSTCLSNIWQADVLAATSTTNGSTFSLSTIAHGAIVSPAGNTLARAFEQFQDPSPELARSPTGAQLFVTYSAGALELQCGSVCLPWIDTMAVYVANSSTAGATWSTPRVAEPALSGYGLFGTYYPSESYNPAIAVDQNGTLDLAFTYVNFTQCSIVPIYGTNCGPEQEVFVQSTDNGTSFSQPYIVSGNWTYDVNNPNNPDGEYATAVSAGGNLWLAFTSPTCSVPWGSGTFYSLCGFPGSGDASQIVLSEMYQGAGITVTFNETGLPRGTPWNVDVLGNVRQALTPSNLVVSGVPAGATLSWTLPLNLSVGFGTRFAGVPSYTSPSSFGASTTIVIAYSEQVLVNISTVPLFPGPSPTGFYGYCPGYPSPVWNDPACPSMNYNITGGPLGSSWVTPGTSFTVGVAPIGSIYCIGTTCYSQTVMNLSFQSWTGLGNGSVSTTGQNITFTANGPVNETANFALLGYCTRFFPPFYTGSTTCWASNTTVAFRESGLPSGTNWSVTASSPYATTSSYSTTQLITINGTATVGPIGYHVWTIPAPSGYWVPSTSPSSPVLLPTQGLVTVNYTFTHSLAGDSFPATFSTSGLPGGLAWSYDLNSSSYGVASGNVTSTTVAAGSYTVTGGNVTATNGTEYVVTGVDRLSEVVNQSAWSNVSAPATWTVHGPAQLVLVYTARYWVDVEASVGGTAGPASAFFASGAGVTLSESALPGYHFVAWTGTGPGAVSGTVASPTAHPLGPVTELATFGPNVLPGNNVTFSEVGLPAGTNFTFELDGYGRTGSGSVTVPAVLNGSHAFVGQQLIALGAGVEALLNSTTSSYTSNPNGTWNVNGSGTVQFVYFVYDYVSTSMVGSGTVAFPAGWFLNGTTANLTETPSSGWLFESITSSIPAVHTSQMAAGEYSITINGPATIIVEFVRAPPAVIPRYDVTVDGSGLPSGATWNVSATSSGLSTGASGSGSSVTVHDLIAGNYTFHAATVYLGSGTRYVPANGGNVSVQVPSATPVSVQYTVEYEVTVVAGPGGTAGPPSEWVASGTTVTLTATPNASSKFVGWTGTGNGAYTGTTVGGTLNVTGPVTEVAAFGPIPPTASSGGSSSSFPTIGVALLAVLLVVGVVVGLLVGRRGGSGGRASPAPETAEPESAPPAEAGDTPPEVTYGESPPAEGSESESS